MPIYDMFTDYTKIENLSNEIDCKKLLEEVYEYKIENSQGVQLSNRGGWQSQFLDYSQIENKFPLLKTLFDLIIREVENLIESPKKTYLTSAWINVNGPGDYNTLHTHPGSHFSGTFYVEMPEGLAEQEGMLEFLRERSYMDYNMQSIYTRPNQYTVEKFKVKPQIGDIVIFPSYIQHEVTPHFCDGDRISIAFNCVIESVDI